MPAKLDYAQFIGQRFGQLTFLGESPKPPRKGVVLGRFLCGCGEEVERPARPVIRGKGTAVCTCNFRKPVVLTDEQRRQLVDEYRNGALGKDLADKYGIAKMSVFYILDQFGIAHHSNSFAVRKTNKRSLGITINEDAFRDLSDERVAYWVGFLLGDGALFPPNKIGLLLKDLDHLEKFRSFLQSTHKIGNLKNGCYQFQFCSQEIFDDLGALGITPKKSFTAKPPEVFEGNRHFWRGLVDADGSLSFYQRHGHTYNVSVVRLAGTEETCGAFIRYTDKHVVECKKRTYRCGSSDSTREASVGGKKAIKLAHHLYDGATEYLTRKMNIAMKMAS